MHFHFFSFAFTKSAKTLFHVLFLSVRKRKVAPRKKYQPTRIHFTRAFIKKRMAAANQENVELREEVGNLKEGLEKLTTMMNALLASQATQAQAVQAQAVQVQAAQDLAAQALAAQNQVALALAAQNQEALANQNHAT